MDIQQWNKVAKITLLFWLMKIVATTLGETLGDFFSMTLNLGYLVSLGLTFLFFIVVLINQLLAKRYIPVFYWLVIIGTTTLGTEISDFLDRTWHFGYALGSLILFLLLIVTLYLWYMRYKSLKVYPIFERGKEVYFWIAVLFSNSLGTAFGDFLGDNLGFSYFQGALITAGIIILVLLLHYFTKINNIVLFWIAFIFTRPFGATFGDFLTKSHEKGGMNLGTLPSTLICVAIITVLIIISHVKEKKETHPIQQFTVD